MLWPPAMEVQGQPLDMDTAQHGQDADIADDYHNVGHR